MSAKAKAKPGCARRGLSLLLRVTALLAVGAPVFSVMQVAAVRFVDPPFTLTMVQRVAEGAGDGLRWVDYRPVALAALGEVPQAAVSSEDGRFFVHHGFDWVAICDAVASNRAGKPLRGGSTISQQVARNVFLVQRRSWVRKALEAWYTVWLELLVPKERILELYVNVAETGPHVFGFEAAAQHWYHKPASRLTRAEAARLVALLPNPRERTPSGREAAAKERWLVGNRAPFPGEPGFERVEREWAASPWPWACP